MSLPSRRRCPARGAEPPPGGAGGPGELSPAGAARGAPGPGPAAAADVREPLSRGAPPAPGRNKGTLYPAAPSVCLSVCLLGMGTGTGAAAGDTYTGDIS